VYAHRRVEDQGAVAQPAPGRLLPDEGDVDFVVQWMPSSAAKKARAACG
jgi:hypothetical protein